MATNIASLNINLFARIDQMTAGLRRAEGRVRSFGSGIARVASGVGRVASRIAAPLAAVAGGGGIIAITRNALTAGDALGKMADQLGISTESLAQLQFASGLAGVESEALAKAMARLGRSSAQAVQGLAEPLRAFQLLGLDAKAFAALPLDQQLFRLAGALEKVQNTSQRIDIVQSLLGRGGVPLLSLLAQGEEKLRAQAQEATNLGLAISRIDAASFEETNDAVSKIGSAFRGVGNELATQFGPLIEFAADNLTDAIARAGPFVRSLAADIVAFAKNALIGVAGVVSVFANLGAVIDSVATKIESLSVKSVSFLAGAGAGLARAAGFNTAANVLGSVQTVGDVQSSLLGSAASQQFNGVLKTVGTDIDAMRMLLEQASATGPVVNAGTGALLLDDDDLVEATQANTRALEDVKRSIDDIKLSNAALSSITRDLREIARATHQSAVRRY